MHGIFTYIWLTFMVNVGKYTIHGCYGKGSHDSPPPHLLTIVAMAEEVPLLGHVVLFEGAVKQ